MRRCIPTWAFPLTIGPDCVIGHNVILHGCTIGANALIGMGAIVLNGARIGAGSLVGAGALITEGKSFPERSLIVGAPARAIRTLDDAAVHAIAGGAGFLRPQLQALCKGTKADRLTRYAGGSLRLGGFGLARLCRGAGDAHLVSGGNAVRRIDHHAVVRDDSGSDFDLVAQIARRS